MQSLIFANEHWDLQEVIEADGVFVTGSIHKHIDHNHRRVSFQKRPV